MSYLVKVPWLYVILLFLTYALFGWLLTESLDSLRAWVIDIAQYWGILLSDNKAQRIVYIAAIVLIMLINLALIFPFKIFKMSFGSWVESDKKAFLSVFFWAFAVVLIICWLEFFLRLLVLLAAAIVTRLEFQRFFKHNWQMLIILSVISLSGFAAGCLSFIYWNIGFS